MRERSIHLPLESKGHAPGRGRLKGRRILVVGGGQMEIGEADTPIGNGRAMSVLFAREGAAVAVTDRDEAQPSPPSRSSKRKMATLLRSLPMSRKKKMSAAWSRRR